MNSEQIHNTSTFSSCHPEFILFNSSERSPRVATRRKQRSLWVKWVNVLVAQLCPTLWDPKDCSPPGSSVHAWNSPGKNTREWVAIPFSRGSSRPRDPTWVYLPYRQILYYLNHRGSPYLSNPPSNDSKPSPVVGSFASSNCNGKNKPDSILNLFL